MCQCECILPIFRQTDRQTDTHTHTHTYTHLKLLYLLLEVCLVLLLLVSTGGVVHLGREGRGEEKRERKKPIEPSEEVSALSPSSIYLRRSPLLPLPSSCIFQSPLWRTAAQRVQAQRRSGRVSLTQQGAVLRANLAIFFYLPWLVVWKKLDQCIDEARSRLATGQPPMVAAPNPDNLVLDA